MNILLCEPGEVDSDGRALIEGPRAEHLRKILRLSPGDEVAAGILGRGRGWARILELAPGRARIELMIELPPRPPYPLVLAVGMVRPIQMKRILKTAASFGIAALEFLPTALGEESYRRAGIWNEYRRHLLEGAAQGGLAFLPTVERHDSLRTFLDRPRPGLRRLLFDLEDPKEKHGESAVDGDGAVLLIGSERGWSDAERRLIGNAGWEGRTLGDRILTTETACTAAMTLTLRELGLF